MGTAPNNAGMRLQAGPPVPAGVGHSPSAARGPEPSVGDSVNELSSSTNGPGLPTHPTGHMLCLPINSRSSFVMGYVNARQACTHIHCVGPECYVVHGQHDSHSLTVRVRDKCLPLIHLLLACMAADEAQVQRPGEMSASR